MARAAWSGKEGTDMERRARRLALYALGCAALLGVGRGAGTQGLPQPIAAASAATHRPRRNLQASAIQLVPPDVSVALLSQVPATITVQCRYEGSGALTFSLAEAPEDMTVEPENGALSWTPPIESEGSEVDVRVRATDGTSTGEVAFTLRVASTQPVAATLAGQTLTVTQAGTLQGLAFTFPAQTSVPPGQVAVAALTAGQAPPIPDGVTRLSDFFRATPVQATGEMITITMPATGLPAGRKPQDLRLFVYSDTAGSVGPGVDVSGPFWIRTWYDLDVLPNGKVTIKLMGLGELSFIGIDPPVTPAPSPVGPLVSRLQDSALAVSASCAPLIQINGLPDLNRRICLITGDVTMTVVVKSFTQLKANPAATVDDLLSWLVAARVTFTGLGLSADPRIEVVVEPMPQANWLGFVTTDKLEDRRVVHITDAQEPKPILQATAAHEYFHHAQSRTLVPGRVNLIERTHATDWLIEGTARWFEDEVCDSVDSYRTVNESPLPPVLSAGLNAQDSGSGPSWPYNRFAFWKLIRSHCPGFSLPQILNIDPSVDYDGLETLMNKLGSPEWQCDFRSGLGDAYRATLAGALHHYAYATQGAGNMSMLDANESPFDFARAVTIIPDASCHPANCPGQSSYSDRVQPAGVVSLRIAAVPSLGPHDQVELRFHSTFPRPESIAWVVGLDEPEPLMGGTTVSLAAPVEYRYGNGSAPEVFVTFISPSSNFAVLISVEAQIRDTSTAPFEGTLAYQPGDLLQGVTFQITTAGTVTGPKGLRLEETAPEYWTHEQIHFTAHVPKTPATIVMTGTIDAVPSQTSGRVDYPDGSYTTWVFQNRHLGGDIGCSGSGNSFTMSVPDWATWDTNRYCRVYWDTEQTRYDKDGKVLYTGPYGGAEMGEVKIEVIHQQ